MTKKLTRREKYSLYAASGIICLFIIMQFIVLPVFDKQDRLKRNLKVKTKILQDMIALKSEHDAIIQRND